MTKDSKERVRTQKLRATRRAQSKLLSPLPAKLKQLAQPSAFTAAGKKLQELPAFVDFEPLDELHREALPEQQENPQTQAAAEVKKRIVGAQREKNKDAGKKPAVSSKPFAADKKSAAPKQESKKEAKSSPRTAKLTAVSKDSRGAAKPVSAKKGKPGIEKKTVFESTPKAQPGSIAAKQAAAHKSAAPRGSAPRTLAVLLEQVADLSQGLETRKPESVSAVSAEKAQVSPQPVAALKYKKHKKSSFAAGKTKTKSTAAKSSKPKAAAAKPKPAARAAAAQRPAASTEPGELLRDLIAALWRQRRDAANTSPAETPAAEGARQREPGSGAAAGLDSIIPARASSGIRIAELETDTVEPPAAAAPAQQPQSLNRAEELAEQINQVIREQAWLRGVNLP